MEVQSLLEAPTSLVSKHVGLDCVHGSGGSSKLSALPSLTPAPSFLDATSVEDACDHVLRLIHSEEVDAATASQMMKDTIASW